jgi:hypothetical protein
MATIKCRIDPVYVRDVDRTPEEGVRAICTVCHHETRAIGRGEGNIQMCLAQMRVECPRYGTPGIEKNDYIADS